MRGNSKSKKLKSQNKGNAEGKEVREGVCTALVHQGKTKNHKGRLKWT